MLRPLSYPLLSLLLLLAISDAPARMLSLKESRVVAANHLAEVKADKMFPEWQYATLGDKVFPIYRPDIKGVAYYEFPVTNAATGRPAGYILLSRGSHDFQVVSWSVHGLSNYERLVASAKDLGGGVRRVYLLDALSFVAEGLHGDVVARLGTTSVPMKNAEKWKNAKTRYATSYAAYNRASRLGAERDWTRPKQVPIKLSRCKPWRYMFVGAEDDQRMYSQISPHQAPNTTGCYSGCGGTAWAMLFGWADYRASQGDPSWKESWGLYGNQSAVAPRNNDSGVDSMTWEIRNDIGTECVSDQQGRTWPWDMEKAREYISGRSNTGAALTVQSDSINEAVQFLPSRNGDAEDLIDKGLPAVILLGWEHYPLAWGYRKKDCTLSPDKLEFYINDGDGTNRWTNAGTSFVGWIEPGQPVSPGCGGEQATCSDPLKKCCWAVPCAQRCLICIDPAEKCPPNPTSGCQSGFKCCEMGLKGETCRRCVPQRLSCP